MASDLFNELSGDMEADLKPLKKAIAIFKTMEAWGSDNQGQKFTYSVGKTFYPQRHVLVGVFSKLDTGHYTHNPTLVVGLPSQYPDGDFVVRQGWSSKNKDADGRIDDLNQGNTIDWSCKADDVAKPILRFVSSQMRDHPAFKRLQADCVEAVTSAIKPEGLQL